MPRAVIFDLDGVLVDSESLWDDARRELVGQHGGTWTEQATTDMLGMSAPEWSSYMVEALGVKLPAAEIDHEVRTRVEQEYRRRLPLIDGAAAAVRTVAAEWPLGLASSSNREIIELVLELSGLAGAFEVTVSSEEVPHGKPAPDVYLKAAAQIGVEPEGCVAVEDSSNGLRAAAAAGMAVIAVPNPHYPPSDDALALAATRVETVRELTPQLLERAVQSAST